MICQSAVHTFDSTNISLYQNATRRKLRNCGNVTKRVPVETPKLSSYQAETLKLWECYQADACGNSEIEGMLCTDGYQAGAPWKFWNCWNIVQRWESCHQAGGGNSEIGEYCAKMEMLPGGNSEIVGMLSSTQWKLRNWAATRRKLQNCGNVIKQVPSRNSKIEGMLCTNSTKWVKLLEYCAKMGIMSPSRWRKFQNWGILCKDGNATRWKLRNCGNCKGDCQVGSGSESKI